MLRFNLHTIKHTRFYSYISVSFDTRIRGVTSPPLQLRHRTFSPTERSHVLLCTWPLPGVVPGNHRFISCLCSLVLPILKSFIDGKYTVCILLSSIFLRRICMQSLFLLRAEEYAIVGLYHKIFTCLSVDGSLDYFQFGVYYK